MNQCERPANNFNYCDSSGGVEVITYDVHLSSAIGTMLASLALLCCAAVPVIGSFGAGTLQIGGLFPDRLVDVGSGVLPAVKLAVRHINERADVLPAFDISIDEKDTKVALQLQIRRISNAGKFLRK